MSVEVQAGSQSWYESSVSDVPADSLLMLAQAGLNLFEGRPDAETTWFLEPDEVLWRWKRVDDSVQFSILAGNEEVVGTAGTVQQLLFPVWRALRSLECNDCWNSDAFAEGELWSHAFPNQETALLGQYFL